MCLLNPEFGNFYLWNAESWALESDMQLKESRIPLRILGTRNTSSTDKESRIRGVESRIQESWIRLHGQNSFSLCFITSLTCLMLFVKCYDVRFPELSTILAQQGAHILTYPSAFTQITGSAHWEVCFACKHIAFFRYRCVLVLLRFDYESFRQRLKSFR